MLEIYTEAEAAKILRKDEITLRNLIRQRKISYCKGKPITFLPEHLSDYQKSIEVKRCAENHTLASTPINQETYSPLIGTSNIMTEKEANVALRAVKLARKTMKPKCSSRTSSSSANGQQQEIRMS